MTDAPARPDGEVVFLGIDPGLASTGFGVVAGDGRRNSILEFGCLHTKAGVETPLRLLAIYRGVCEVIARCKPVGLAVEDVFSAPRMPGAALALGEVRGVIMIAAAEAGLPVIQLPARQVKQAITGSGAADKEQLERALRSMTGWKEAIRPSHASDALAIAIVGLSRWKTGRWRDAVNQTT